MVGSIEVCDYLLEFGAIDVIPVFFSPFDVVVQVFVPSSEFLQGRLMALVAQLC